MEKEKMQDGSTGTPNDEWQTGPVFCPTIGLWPAQIAKVFKKDSAGVRPLGMTDSTWLCLCFHRTGAIALLLLKSAGVKGHRVAKFLKITEKTQFL